MKTACKLILAAIVLAFPLCVTSQNVITTETEITFSETGELTGKGLTQVRDMASYDKGGHFDCHGWTREPRDICDEKKVRDFIWQHWTDKKRGYIRITYGSVDARSTSHIFIEPNEKCEWRIAVRIARFHSMQEYNNRIDDILGLVTVERVEGASKDEWSIAIKRGPGTVVYKIPE